MVGQPLAATVTPSEGPIPRPAWLPDWVPGWLPDFVATIVVVVLAWVVARLLVRLFNRRIARRYGRPSITRTLLRGIRIGVYVIALLAILRIHGLDLGNIALSVTVFSAVIGVVLAPIIGSYISGMFLLADQPYEIGDMVELPDRNQRGFVEDITLRYTKIFTVDNTFVVIPNGSIRERDVINFSAEDPRTRRSIEVLVTYESDLEEARERIENAARQVDSVIGGGPDIRIGASRYPASPQCLVSSFATNGVLLKLRYWVSEPYRLPTIRSQVQREIDAALADVDVEYAYPHSHLVFDDTSGEIRVVAGAEGDVDENAEEPAGEDAHEA
ncbi:MAG: mechanosensitive ion channel family protein [Haloarculaceae archaeon]